MVVVVAGEVVVGGFLGPVAQTSLSHLQFQPQKLSLVLVAG